MFIRRFPLPAILVALAAILCGLLVAAPRAEATSTLLCKGFAGCKAAGYARFGYKSAYTQMWWRMYAGHNCTNYVAYRMVRSGMSATRPWSGSGDARNWGYALAPKVNQTPTVGSIAWWSTSHVAYVEQVIDANTIVISEDHWGGDFDWRKIVRAGGGWPTGFIHLNDEALAATSAPTISGTPKVDVPLTASPGGWNKAGATYTYQWLANGVAIPQATGATYTPTAQQVGARFAVRVTASKYAYKSGSSDSAVTVAAAPGTMTATAAPTVTGVAKVGGVLTVSGGAMTPAPTTTAISWRADGAVIAGATGPTLTLGAAHLDRRITAVVTGSRAGYTSLPVSSAPTAPVGPEKLVVTQEPALVGEPRLGQRAGVAPGAVAPGDVVPTYRWLRGRTPIPGATAAGYVPSLDDLGRRLGVRVTFSRPGYTPVERVLRFPARVQARPSLRVESSDRRRATVTVRADGVRSPAGTVTLVNARGERRTRTLERGQATFSLAWLPAGRRTLTVIYDGSRRVEARTVSRVVAVR